MFEASVRHILHRNEAHKCFKFSDISALTTGDAAVNTHVERAIILIGKEIINLIARFMSHHTESRLTPETTHLTQQLVKFRERLVGVIHLHLQLRQFL